MDAQTAVRIHTDNSPEMTHLSVWIRTDNNTSTRLYTGPALCIVILLNRDRVETWGLGGVNYEIDSALCLTQGRPCVQSFLFDTGLALCIVILVTLDTGPSLCIDTSITLTTGGFRPHQVNYQVNHYKGYDDELQAYVYCTYPISPSLRLDHTCGKASFGICFKLQSKKTSLMLFTPEPENNASRDQKLPVSARLIFTARCYAERGHARVSLSVCSHGLFVTLRYDFHTRWISSKTISRPNSSRDQVNMDVLKANCSENCCCRDASLLRTTH